MYLDQSLRRDLIALAKREKKSMAEVARVILKEGVERKKKIDTSGISVMEKLMNLNLKGGPRDLSKNIDHYLYGGPKKK